VGPTRLFDSYNAGYVQAMYEEYIRNPASVDESWRRIFAEQDGAGAPGAAAAVAAAAAGPPAAQQLRVARAAGELVDAYRLQGHTAARLDPLGSDPPGHPLLNPEFHGITEADLEAVPSAPLELSVRGDTVAEAVEWLRENYTRSIGYQYEHLEDPERREWLREEIESGAHGRPLESGEQRRLLERLTEVEAFEQFLHRAYLGQKRFSVEGTDMLVPMLDLAIERAAAAGAREVVLGMAHRGRLNVLTHVLGRPYRAILAEFEKQHAGIGTTGDVKYHLGAEGTYATVSGEPLTVTLAPNPSHLEFVDPIVEGLTRAKQTDRSGTALVRDEACVLPVLIHGDAAFSAQGVVAETLNLSRLDGYRTGGTLHLIANNQVGFTTDPSEGRSTRYTSDLALGFNIPVFHVNADDPEACLAAVRLALAYREAFHGDVVIDLVGYRRYGHNEGDEPGYTQPLMYERIAEHQTVRRIWADLLVERGVLEAAEVEAVWESIYGRLVAAQEEVKQAADGNGRYGPPALVAAKPEDGIDTALPPDRILALDAELHRWPDDFTLHPKLARTLERRAKALSGGRAIDWAHAEALALASVLADGRSIRMTGQDVQRGTFSQRHLVLHDPTSGRKHCPLAHLDQARAPFELYNSPLSEIGALGFEYGYSTAAPEALVVWEAQFGDFANVAQVIIDQFIAAGRAKWGQIASLVMLLPHGYEGQGPEHSSARLERFLQLAAEDNIRVANCTTPAQYFHLLRRQALLEKRRPLVVMTPKSLLRHPRAVSGMDELADHSFAFVLDDEERRDSAERVTRVILCTGKVYYDLAAADQRQRAEHVAIVRVEQLYPFPEDELAQTLEGFPALEEVVWAQEEPENMGAWRYMEPRIQALLGEGVRPGYVGRPERASPAEGFATAHDRQQAKIIDDAFNAPPVLPRVRRAAARPGRR
jgi:2-oxoglutarate dehydrogenase E1 component